MGLGPRILPFLTVVAFTLWFPGCQTEGTEPADLVVLNGNVYSADGTGAFAEAVAVRGNRILRVGARSEIEPLAGDTTTVIDARGGAVVPGFNDSHVHFMGGGLGLDKVNLLDAETFEQIQEKIESFAAANPDRAWVLGRGWYYGPFPDGMPTKRQLDAMVPDRPAAMRCYDSHTSWVNSKALELAGITRDTPDPENGVIEKDPKTGEPTGILKEAAQGLLDDVLPEVTREDRLRAIRAAAELAHSFGVTSIQNASGTPEELELYDELRRAGELKIRVYSSLSTHPDFQEEEADRFDAVWKMYPDDPLFKTGAVKLSADGVIESHTAAMLAPYANRPTSGVRKFSAEDMNRIVTMMDRRGWQIFIHAIGDGMVRQALDAYEHAAEVNPAPARGRRHRIEHIETIDPADIPRFGKLGVIASMQPYHANPSPNQLEIWAGNIGPDRASRAWVWKSIQDAGGHLAFGSDWSVVSIDPRIGIHVAVNRTTPRGSPPGGWLPEQKLPLTKVIDAYTIGAAYASFDEYRKGSLAPGMLADLVLLSTDIFRLPPEKVLDAVVEVTIFDGEVVYERDSKLES
jgi:predicted amidohydrolase YtcJ